jgi:hypothetical protein
VGDDGSQLGHGELARGGGAYADQSINRSSSA